MYIIGMEENLLPHRVSVEEDNIAEERRLAYVGITRAQQTLAMTLATKRRQFGETINCRPSRFIAELPPGRPAMAGRRQRYRRGQRGPRQRKPWPG